MKTQEKRCTGLTARWCPIHGDCTCSQDDSDSDYNDDGCPLHGVKSDHAPIIRPGPPICQGGSNGSAPLVGALLVVGAFMYVAFHLVGLLMGRHG